MNLVHEPMHSLLFLHCMTRMQIAVAAASVTKGASSGTTELVAAACARAGQCLQVRGLRADLCSENVSVGESQDVSFLSVVSAYRCTDKQRTC